MARKIDFAWLLSQAADTASKKRLKDIRKWRQTTLRGNRFLKSRALFRLDLAGLKLWFRRSSAFASIETYQEIFKEKGHFLCPAFSAGGEGVVVDVGANEGFYALKLKSRFPQARVICLEPNPEAFDILKRNIRANRLKNVTALNRAAAARSGWLRLEAVRAITAITAKDLKAVPRPWLEDGFISVIRARSVRLEDVLRQNRLSRVDILKIDAEGMEEEILKGLGPAIKKVRRIVVEYHSRRKRRRVIAFLRTNRFALVLEPVKRPGAYYNDLYFINKDLS